MYCMSDIGDMDIDYIVLYGWIIIDTRGMVCVDER